MNEAIQQTSVSSTNFELRNASYALVPSTVTYNAETLTATLTPASILTYETTYTVTVKGGTSGVKDLAGNPMTNDVVWSFTTAATPNYPVLDKTVTTKQASGNSVISSPGISTAQPNELLVAFIASDGPSTGGTQQISAVTGGGLTWTLRVRANAQAGTAEIWTAPATNVVSNLIVTA